MIAYRFGLTIGLFAVVVRPGVSKFLGILGVVGCVLSVAGILLGGSVDEFSAGTEVAFGVFPVE